MDLKKDLDDFVRDISRKSTFSGNKMPDSVMKQVVVEIRPNGGGVLAPYWLGVFQRGRGPRKSTKDSGLWKRIFAWMKKNNLFKSYNQESQISEAKSVTWYINKYGNRHFRNKQFVDIYDGARKKLVKKLDEQYGQEVVKITEEIL